MFWLQGACNVQSVNRCECVLVRKRPSVQCKSLCISREHKRERHQKEARWLLAFNLSLRTATPFSLRFVLFTRGPLEKQILSRLLREFLILRATPRRVLRCQKSQSSTSRWLRPDSRLASPEGESCCWELSKLVMGDTGRSSSGSASEGRRLICLKKG